MTLEYTVCLNMQYLPKYSVKMIKKKAFCVSTARISTTEQPYGTHNGPTVWCRQTDRTQWFSSAGSGWIHAYLQSHPSPTLWESKSPQGHSTACWPFKYLSITAFNFPSTAGPSPLAVTFLRDVNHKATFLVICTVPVYCFFVHLTCNKSSVSQYLIFAYFLSFAVTIFVV